MTEKIEKMLLETFDILDKTKETCKVLVSHSIQSMTLSNNIIRASLESIDTIELCKFFIINRSPNIKNCVIFTIKVLRRNHIENNGLMNDKYFKNMLEYANKHLEKTINQLEKLSKSI